MKVKPPGTTSTGRGVLMRKMPSAISWTLVSGDMGLLFLLRWELVTNCQGM